MIKTRILIVEDESIVAIDLKQRLINLGYDIVGITASGEKAISLAAKLQPDLVLMDIKLKGQLNGIASAKEIQLQKDTPIIYLTAFADERTLQRAEETAPYGYLLKPFEERELHTTIKMALYKHRLEMQLKESQQWLAATLNSIGEGVIATDAQGAIEFMNPAAEEITGWTQDEALGKDLMKVFNTINEETETPLENPLMAELKEEAIVNFPASALLITKTGKRRPIQENAAPIEGGQGRAAGVVLAFRDVTEERAIQERIQQQERLATVGQLSAGIAHEFNNILTSIIGFTELLRRQTDIPLSAQNKLEHIATQGERAARLTRQIQDFGQKSLLQKRPLNLTQLLQETVRLLRRTVPYRIDIHLRIEPDCKKCEANVDPTFIQQALTNLASNAVDAMPAGGKLNFRLARCVFEPGDQLPSLQISPGNWLCLFVSDTGAGILSQTLPRIFEPFFTTKEVGQGTGLGLAQVDGIVKQHQGDILVESVAGKGTTFSLYLPCLPQEARSPQLEEAVTSYGQNEVILLVDDEPLVLDVLQAMLQHLNYRTLRASGGQEAIATYRRRAGDIALILADIDILKAGDMALPKAIRGQNPGLKIGALSNYPLLRQAAKIEAYGIVDWAQKPISINSLAQMVNRMLSHSNIWTKM